MSSDYYYAPSKNGIQKTLSAQLLSTASTGDAISLSDVDGIQNKPGVLVINRVDSNGTATPAAREYISFTGTSGSTVLIETRNVDNSTSAKTHAVGSVVEFIPDVVWAQRIIDQQLVEHSVAGVHGSAAVTSIETAAVADKSPILNSSMARQAVINGNFDVWQRGTSLVVTAASSTFLADRWRETSAVDGGTNPTLTRSRQLLTSGDIPNAFYYTRLNTNGAGSGYGNSAHHFMLQSIENGTRFLCGLNKTVTVSFWARSDIANKRLGFYINQSYGSGGSPSTSEVLTGSIINLTSTWTKYTKTFTTNTLAGKTFGTANDDIVQLGFSYMWGTTTATQRFGGGTAETFVGSGNIDIAQVQLCAGDVALPFQPKSYDDEQKACLRYYERVPFYRFYGTRFSNDNALVAATYLVHKRTATNVTLANTTGNNFHDGTAVMGGTIAIAAQTPTITATYLQLSGFTSVAGSASRSVVGYNSADFVVSDCEL